MVNMLDIPSNITHPQFLHNVSINLKPGGYFFGTVPDGRRVNECIRGSLTYQSPMLTVEARWKGSPGCFGSAYICAIGDTVTGCESRGRWVAVTEGMDRGPWLEGEL